MFDAINTSNSGMEAMKEMLEVTANNIANMDSTRTKNGGPYHRQSVVLEATRSFNDVFQGDLGSGVRVQQIQEDGSEKLSYDPQNPDANADGYVRLPAINLAAEMTNMITAQRGYEANATILSTIKKMTEKEDTIGKN